MKQKSLRAFSLVLIFALCLSLLSACDGEKVNILAEANSEPISNESKDMAYYAKTLLDEKNPLGIVGSVCPADGGIYIEGKTINYTDGTFKSALYFAEKNGEIKSVNSDWLGESNITGMCAAEGGGFWLVKSTYLSKDNAEHELGYFENGEYSRLSELEKTDKMFIQGLCAAKGRIFISESDARGTNLIKAYKPGGEKDFEVNVGGTNFDFVGDGALLYIGKHDESRAVKVCKLDPENRNIQELTSFDRGRLLACSGEKLYIGDSTGLVEYDTASKNTRRLFLWSECGLSGNTSSIWPQENGSFIVEEYSLIKNIYQDVKK